ncbi:hypothetical protein DFH09DRAFT_1076941 [Mycena vulgaris]|nr:hypothetical protein DFH09DRAFT_1076941 [Mycena vulgaris]
MRSDRMGHPRGISLKEKKTPASTGIWRYLHLFSSPESPQFANDMHRALNIMEVVEIVTSHLSPSLPDERGALASLAVTCETFHDPALDALWRSQNTIKNILSCMPGDLFTPAPALAADNRPLRMLRSSLGFDGGYL